MVAIQIWKKTFSHKEHKDHKGKAVDRSDSSVFSYTRKRRLSHGSDTDETRIKDENLEQEKTERTEENADSLFPLLSPVSSSVFLFICVHPCLSVANDLFGCEG